MNWDGTIRLGDLLTLFAVLVAAGGLVFAGVQVRRDTRIQRARFLLDSVFNYLGDADVRRFYYRLDYHDWEFDPDEFPHSDEERWLDHLIYVFDVIGNLLQMEVLSLDEVRVVAFQASRVLRNPEVESYLRWLDTEYRRLGRSSPAHPDARYLVQRLAPDHSG